MSNQHLAYDQRVLCIGLRKMTKDTALIRSGFLHWHKTLASQEFSIDNIVTELVDYLGVGVGEKKTLMLTLHAARNKLFDELPPVPAVLLNMVEGSVGAPITDKDDLSISEGDDIVAAKPAHCIITEAFLLHLTAHIKKYSRDALADLKNILISENIENIGDQIHRLIKQWATDGFDKIGLPGDVTETECYNITHGVYMFMIEICGPVESDKIIDRVIEDTLKLDAAARFSPRNLL